MIPIAQPTIGKEEEQAVLHVLRSGNIAQGEKVAEFEEKFAKYIGSKYAIATSSGTAALHIALMAAGVGTGDEVITAAFSFIAAANACLYVGAKPVFVDICAEDFTINPRLIVPAITKKTKAIIPIHLFGCPANMKEIARIARTYDVLIIEDACQAHGAAINGKKVGSFGRAGCFSFYATKNMTTGEGGMITTNDKRFAQKCYLLRSHGATMNYHHNTLGFNFRMTDIEAALGIEQLKKLPDANKTRSNNASYLHRKIQGQGIILPNITREKTHVFHQYTLRITNDACMSRDTVLKTLQKNSIDARLFYPIPIYQQKLYRELGFNTVPLPVTERVAKEVLSVPIHSSLTQKDLDYIAETINTCVG